MRWWEILKLSTSSKFSFLSLSTHEQIPGPILASVEVVLTQSLAPPPPHINLSGNLSSYVSATSPSNIFPNPSKVICRVSEP